MYNNILYTHMAAFFKTRVIHFVLPLPHIKKMAFSTIHRLRRPLRRPFGAALREAINISCGDLCGDPQNEDFNRISLLGCDRFP